MRQLKDFFAFTFIVMSFAMRSIYSQNTSFAEKEEAISVSSGSVNDIPQNDNNESVELSDAPIIESETLEAPLVETDAIPNESISEQSEVLKIDEPLSEEQNTSSFESAVEPINQQSNVEKEIETDVEYQSETQLDSTKTNEQASIQETIQMTDSIVSNDSSALKTNKSSTSFYSASSWQRLSMYGDLSGSVGGNAPLIPSLWGLNVAYENSFASIFPAIISSFVHAIRFDVGYTGYSSIDSVSTIRLEVGPEWFIAPWSSKFGRFHLSAMPGLTWLSIQTQSGPISGALFSATVLAGYEYSLEAIGLKSLLSHAFIFAHARASFIYDSNSPWTGLGGDLGLGMKF